tara:strand:- start:314 stop:787 length:474 start_codon:yes stop_codon:yes gene_type:complete
MKKLALLDSLSYAFGSTKQPSCPLINRPNLDWEDKEVIRVLAGKSWQNFGIDVIKSCEVDLTAIVYRLNPVYFVYYLPSFMSLCLSNFDEIDVLSDSIFSVLSLSVQGASEYESEFVKLSLNQKSTIRSFIKYFLHESQFDIEKEAKIADLVWERLG